jgi:hypothetical protein
MFSGEIGSCSRKHGTQRPTRLEAERWHRVRLRDIQQVQPVDRGHIASDNLQAGITTGELVTLNNNVFPVIGMLTIVSTQ